MFIGRYYHTLEEKGRLSLPKRFRELETEWIVTRGLDGGLFLFKQSDFVESLRELTERTFTNKQHRDFVRLMTNEAHEVSADANGRIHLPEYLIRLAKLEKHVVVVGSFSRIEIWDADTYHTYLETIEPEIESLAETIHD